MFRKFQQAASNTLAGYLNKMIGPKILISDYPPLNSVNFDHSVPDMLSCSRTEDD